MILFLSVSVLWGCTGAIRARGDMVSREYVLDDFDFTDISIINILLGPNFFSITQSDYPRVIIYAPENVVDMLVVDQWFFEEMDGWVLAIYLARPFTFWSNGNNRPRVFVYVPKIVDVVYGHISDLGYWPPIRR